MKVGDLVKVIQGGKLVPPKKWLGKPSLVIAKYDHPQSTKGGFFTVMVAGNARHFHEDYLEVINESR